MSDLVADASDGRADRGRPVVFAIGLLILLGFAAWTRWPLFREGLWRDEALSVYIANSSSLSQFLARSRIADYNPPLFNLLLSLWGRVFGFGEAGLKGLALALGLIADGAVALTTRRLFNSATAALFACAVSINNPILLGVTSELRPYSFSVVVSMVALTLAVETARESSGDGGIWRWLLLVASLTVATYSQVAGGLFVAAIGLCGLALIGLAPTRRNGIRIFAAAALAGLSFLFWFPTTVRQYRVGLPHSSRLSLEVRWNMLRGSLGEVIPWGVPLFTLILVIVVLMSFGGRGRSIERDVRRRLLPVTFVLTSALAVLVPLGLFSPVRRHVVLASALLSILLGAALAGMTGIVKAGSLIARAAAVIVVVIVLAASFVARIQFYRDVRHRADAGEPKSGIRTFCRQQKAGHEDLLIAAPDYLAATVWYYCGSESRIRGFVRWEDAPLLDMRRYAEQWKSPDSVARTLEATRKYMATSGDRDFYLIWDRNWDGPPLFFLRRVTNLKKALEERYRVEISGRYSGRLEDVGFVEFETAGERIGM